MPKIIDNLRNRILDSAERHLSEKGYHGLTIREIADECGIASGTVYNYFNSKEMLVATIIGNSWIETLDKTDTAICDKGTVREGLLCIFDGLESFCLLYMNLWKDYGKTGSENVLNPQRHSWLVDALSQRVANVLEETGYESEYKICQLIAEIMLSFATQGKQFRDYEAELERIIRKKSPALT